MAATKSGELVSISIVFPEARVPSSDITELSMTESLVAVTEALESTDIEWMIGGIDVSLNDDTQKGLQEEWQLQLYGIAMVKNRVGLGSLLRSKFERTKEVFGLSSSSLVTAVNGHRIFPDCGLRIFPS